MKSAKPIALSSPARDAVPGAVVLGRLIDPQMDGPGWWVSAGGQMRLVAVDDSVDPALLAEARAQGARVLIEEGAEEGPSPSPAAIVGVVLTARPLTIDRAGVVDAHVERFSITARSEAVLKSASAFLRLNAAEVEIYGVRCLLRAREAARVLARMIALN